MEPLPNYKLLVYNNFKTLKIICEKFIDQYIKYNEIFKEIHENDGKKYKNDFLIQNEKKKK